MSNAEASNEKFLVHCQDGANNPERATISFILAFTSSKTAETAMFISAEASELCVKGSAEKVLAPGYEPLADLMMGYIKNGGKIWLCPACAKAKSISETDLVAGVEIAGAPKAMAFLTSGAHVLA